MVTAGWLVPASAMTVRTPSGPESKVSTDPASPITSKLMGRCAISRMPCGVFSAPAVV